MKSALSPCHTNNVLKKESRRYQKLRTMTNDIFDRTFRNFQSLPLLPTLRKGGRKRQGLSNLDDKRIMPEIGKGLISFLVQWRRAHELPVIWSSGNMTDPRKGKAKEGGQGAHRQEKLQPKDSMPEGQAKVILEKKVVLRAVVTRNEIAP